MAIDLEGDVGFQIVGEGASSTFRLGRSRELIVGDGHGRYFECVRTGRVFTAGVASVAPGTALGTTPPLDIYNDIRSGGIAALLGIAVGYVSGTIGAGSLVLAQTAQNTVPTGGSNITPQSNILGGGAGSRMKAGSGRTIAAAATQVAPVATLNPTLATAPAAGGFAPASSTWIELGGLYIIPPGVVACLQGVAAAGTTPLVMLAAVWEELEIAVAT